MDIDDILRDLQPQDPLARNGHSSRNTGQADLQALTRAWVNERSSPELLTQVSLPHQPRLLLITTKLPAQEPDRSLQRCH